MWTTETTAAGPASPVSDAVNKVAVFLNYASGRTALRGGDPSIIHVEHPSGVIARLLDLSVGELQAALTKLRDKGLVLAGEGGTLILTDVRAVQTLAMGKEPEPFIPVMKAAA